MPREFRYQVGDAVRTATVERQERYVQVTVGELVVRMALPDGPSSHLDLELADQRARAFVARSKRGRYVSLEGQSFLLAAPAPAGQRRDRAGAEQGSLTATMPGRVLDVVVEPGQGVAKGDTLVLLEAMKMELRIQAPLDGVVARVHCKAGQVVERGELLVEVQPHATTA